MKARRNGTPMLASSGYVAQINSQACTACAVCVDYCQFGALASRNGSTHVDQETCMGCGVCVSKCARGAITLRREPGRGEPLEIQKLLREAAAA